MKAPLHQAAALWIFALALISAPCFLLAQGSPEETNSEERTKEITPADLSEADKKAQALLEGGETEDDAGEDGEADPNAPVTKKKSSGINILALLVDGGVLMLPIVFMSGLVAVFGVERFIALRRNRILPAEMVTALGQLTEREGGLDPRLAYRLCQKYRCTAANVIRAVLLKVGRPHAEVEHAVTEASEREAAMLYKNIRPINLAMAICPLLGLLGTVWGMIEAFRTTSEAVGGAKAQDLASGIYVALVTTLAGLAVAIVAAIMAHYFEGRIQNLFREIDDLIHSLLPQLERYEGKLRMTRSSMVNSPGEEPSAAPETEPTKPKAAAASE
ncbi:MAG: MotA/TolQ/ExbB proton channel family protein [Planctomycetales bacterium]